jgi:hypothetical protein
MNARQYFAEQTVRTHQGGPGPSAVNEDWNAHKEKNYSKGLTDHTKSNLRKVITAAQGVLRAKPGKPLYGAGFEFSFALSDLDGIEIDRYGNASWEMDYLLKR